MIPSAGTYKVRSVEKSNWDGSRVTVRMQTAGNSPMHTAIDVAESDARAFYVGQILRLEWRDATGEPEFANEFTRH